MKVIPLEWSLSSDLVTGEHTSKEAKCSSGEKVDGSSVRVFKMQTGRS